MKKGHLGRITGGFIMQIGEVIRKYRKERNMTQEEMANRLGVTAPAVNKWENGNTMPDILLLAPIARLLHISIDTLMSFQIELTEDEIHELVDEADERLKKEPYDTVFQWAKRLIVEYPSCESLIWQMATLLDEQRAKVAVPKSEKYDKYLRECFVRLLDSKNEIMKNRAADSLYNYYVRKKQYGKAEECLNYFSIQNPERKRKQADIYGRTGRVREAYKAYEELLISDFQMVSLVFHDLYQLAMQAGDSEKALIHVEKEAELAQVFEMVESDEDSSMLKDAIAEKDSEKIHEIMEKLQTSAEQVTSFRESQLYAHMDFDEISEDSRTK
jgi:transcriptional regulator with XRE-family HTH domain